MLRVAGLAGWDGPAAQWLFYAISSAHARSARPTWRGLVYRPVSRAAAGLLATFNVFLMVWLPNLLPAVAIGVTGVLAGMAVRAAKGRRVRPLAFAAAILPMSYLALNPPWLLIGLSAPLFVVVATALGGDRAARHRLAVQLLRASPWALLLNLWWIVPFGQNLVAPAGTTFAAVTDVREWAWVHQELTPTHVLTLRSLWVLAIPDLMKYSAAFEARPWSALSYALPALALAGALLAGRRRLRVVALVAAVTSVLLLLSTGLRTSWFGPVDLWLYDHVPGMWLIRDPASKLSVPIVLVYSSLAALAVERIADLTARRRELVRYPVRVAAALLVLAALVYPWPMWTGAVTPSDSRGVVAGFRVSVPTDWYRLAERVNAEPANGKALVLPVNVDHYAVSTTWDYRGVDVIPAQLLTRPTLRLLPGGYYGDGALRDILVVRAQDALLTGDGVAWRGYLRMLGVDTVIVRHDVPPVVFGRTPTADPEAIDTALAAIGGLATVQRFSIATLYRVDAPPGVVTVSSRLVGVRGTDRSRSPRQSPTCRTVRLV